MKCNTRHPIRRPPIHAYWSAVQRLRVEQTTAWKLSAKSLWGANFSGSLTSPGNNLHTSLIHSVREPQGGGGGTHSPCGGCCPQGRDGLRQNKYKRFDRIKFLQSGNVNGDMENQISTSRRKSLFCWRDCRFLSDINRRNFM